MNALQLPLTVFTQKNFVASSEVRFFYGNRSSCIFETPFGELTDNVRWSS